jgi:hypothetical protein
MHKQLEHVKKYTTNHNDTNNNNNISNNNNNDTVATNDTYNYYYDNSTIPSPDKYTTITFTSNHNAANAANNDTIPTFISPTKSQVKESPLTYQSPHDVVSSPIPPLVPSIPSSTHEVVSSPIPSVVPSIPSSIPNTSNTIPNSSTFPNTGNTQQTRCVTITQELGQRLDTQKSFINESYNSESNNTNISNISNTKIFKDNKVHILLDDNELHHLTNNSYIKEVSYKVSIDNLAIVNNTDSNISPYEIALNEQARQFANSNSIQLAYIETGCNNLDPTLCGIKNF